MTMYRWAMAILLCCLADAAAADYALRSAPESLAISDGSVVDVEAGTLQVPESRANPDSRKLTLPYYRLKTTAAKPAAPIFLLAGGPGSSWIDRVEDAEYFSEIAFYRTLADVVVFDQRGGGRAQPAMDCADTAELPIDRALTTDELAAAMQRLLISCRDRWQAEGVDLAAYNTDENARDVDALREALGYDRIILVGGSYGAHLGLHYLRRYPGSVARAVFFGIEGPDHTWDNPSGKLAALRRIAVAATHRPELTGLVPQGGWIEALQRVLKRLDAAAATVRVDDGSASVTVVVDATLVRQIASRNDGSRDATLRWARVIAAMDAGDYSMAARMALQRRHLRLDSPMHYSMDCASGISTRRRQRYRIDPATALLGDINFEYAALCDLWPHRDLGSGFRADVVSDIPVLMLHGTLDASTPMENAREVARGLHHGKLVTVIGGNHGALYNLYARWPPMRAQLAKFLQDGEIDFPDAIDLTPK